MSFLGLDNSGDRPVWANAFGWILTFAVLIWIPIVAAYRLKNAVGSTILEVHIHVHLSVGFTDHTSHIGLSYKLSSFASSNTFQRRLSSPCYNQIYSNCIFSSSCFIQYYSKQTANSMTNQYNINSQQILKAIALKLKAD